jgi:hypothetical protein
MKQADSLVRKPYVLRVDANGFIRPSDRHTRPDLSILFLGGSTTECRYVDEEDRFPYLAALRLEERTGLRINSYNGGVSGSNTMHLIEALLAKGLALHPQVAVLSENVNDLATHIHFGDYWKSRTPRSLLFDARPSGEPERATPRVLLRTLKDAIAVHTYWHVRSLFERDAGGGADEFATVRGQASPLSRDDALQSFSASLRTFVLVCRAWSVRPVLMTQANRLTDRPDAIVRTMATASAADAGLDYPGFKHLYDAFNDAIRRVSGEEHVLLIDLAREVSPESRYLYDSVHYNGTGSHRAADVISQALEPIVVELAKRGSSHSDERPLTVRSPGL